MEHFAHEEIMDYIAAANFLGIPEKVLREWVQLNFRGIPYHKLGNGRRAEIGFFRTELDVWFKRNGGHFLKDKVQERAPRGRYDQKPRYDKDERPPRPRSYGFKS